MKTRLRRRQFGLKSVFIVIGIVGFVLWLLCGVRPTIERYLAWRVSSAVGADEEREAFSAVRKYARSYSVVVHDDVNQEVEVSLQRTVSDSIDGVTYVRIGFDSSFDVVRRLDAPQKVHELLGE